jgi:transposase
MGRTKKRKKTTQSKTPERLVVDHRELATILARLEQLQGADGRISEQDFAALKAVAETLAFLTQELESKGITLRKLRKLVFGPASEKGDHVCPKDPDQPGGDQGGIRADGGKPEAGGTGSEAGKATAGSAPQGEEESEPKKRRKGESHGRFPASAYTGAEKVEVALEWARSGMPCPECPNGKIYPLPEPKVIVRVTAVAPLKATVYRLARWRCNACSEIFTAPAPEGVGTEKYDEAAAALIALFRYDVGLPFSRIEKLEKGFGIPTARPNWATPRYGFGVPRGDPSVPPSRGATGPHPLPAPPQARRPFLFL